ncbi:putative xyloglucan endotransglucosylase/hydrolase protein 27 [Glycine soja]|uniref:Putative xyloglucan endotransglucosylase/hydrolase protein 27 n=1 Tax=Glycine soja TaxID=3848 RepID=A0A445M3B3_GLYSO|nr:putative xyloglucan endotransglucosylase/hydrolase protein 27 [Glycine soja]
MCISSAIAIRKSSSVILMAPSTSSAPLSQLRGSTQVLPAVKSKMERTRDHMQTETLALGTASRACSGNKLYESMMSNGDMFQNNHDEIYFEFLGNIRGKDRRIQTNVYGNGSTSIGREERYGLWFDLVEDFHQYNILWTNSKIMVNGKRLLWESMQRIEPILKLSLPIGEGVNSQQYFDIGGEKYTYLADNGQARHQGHTRTGRQTGARAVGPRTRTTEKVGHKLSTQGV